MMDEREIKSLTGALAPVIKGFVASSIAPVTERVAALEARTPVKGDPGDPGLPGESKEGPAGRGIAETLIDADGTLVLTFSDGVAKSIGRIKGDKGDPGANADVTRVQALEIGLGELKASVQEIAAREVPIPQNGKDAEPITREQIAEAVQAYLAAHPPKDGETVKGDQGDEGRGIRETLIDGDGVLVLTFSDGQVQKAGRVKAPEPDGSRLEDMAATIAGLRSEVAEQKTAIETLSARDTPIDLTAPEDVIEQVAKAAAMIAESPQPKKSAQPVVVNFPQDQPRGRTEKTITLRQSDSGVLIADVVERQLA